MCRRGAQAPAGADSKTRLFGEEGTALFEATLGLIEIVDQETYGIHEAAARERLRRRDEDDWPVLATAHAQDCPMWTEDPGFLWRGRSCLDDGPGRIVSQPPIVLKPE